MADPVSPPTELDWKPLRSGGAAFQTHRLLPSAERLTFVPSGPARLLIGGSALTAAAAPIIGALVWRSSDDAGALVVGGAIGVTMLALALLMRRTLDHRHVFDRATSRYTCTQPDAPTVAFDDIVGLQITRKTVTGPDSNYDSDELNLVLRDGRRVCVLNHAAAPELHADARALAEWLGKPLWVRADLRLEA